MGYTLGHITEPQHHHDYINSDKVTGQLQGFHGLLQRQIYREYHLSYSELSAAMKVQCFLWFFNRFFIYVYFFNNRQCGIYQMFRGCKSHPTHKKNSQISQHQLYVTYKKFNRNQNLLGLHCCTSPNHSKTMTVITATKSQANCKTFTDCCKDKYTGNTTPVTGTQCSNQDQCTHEGFEGVFYKLINCTCYCIKGSVMCLGCNSYSIQKKNTQMATVLQF